MERRSASGGGMRALLAGLLLGLGTSTAAAEDLALEWALQQAAQGNLGVQLAESALLRARGAELAAEAEFEPNWTFDAQLDLRRDALIPAVIRAEINRRRLFELLDESFDGIARDLRAQLDANELAGLECDPGTQFFVDGVNICEEPDRVARRRLLDQLIEELENNPNADPDELARLQALREQARGRNREEFERLIGIFDQNAQSARENRRRLGDVPAVERINTFGFNTSYGWRYRDGSELRPLLGFEVEDNNFEGKTRSPADGGRGIPRIWRSGIGLVWSRPLGRGGEASTAAGEVVARLEAGAREAERLDALASARLAVALAWWDLWAANEQLRIQGANAQSQRQILDIAGALVEADMIESAQLAPARAQVALAEAGQREAEARLRISRERLAGVVGQVESELPPRLSPEAPPDVGRGICAGEESRLRVEALQRRPDRDAALRRLQASERLTLAAQDGRRPRLDFSATIGFTARRERHSARAIADVFGKSLVGPGLVMTLSGDLEPRWRGADARIAQSLALEDQARIRAAEVDRIIVLRVTELARRLDGVAAEYRQRQRAVEAYAETVEHARLRLRSNEIALIDVISTEIQYNLAELAWADVRRRQARLYAELAYETGRLADPLGSVTSVASLLRTHPCAR